MMDDEMEKESQEPYNEGVFAFSSAKPCTRIWWISEKEGFVNPTRI